MWAARLRGTRGFQKVVALKTLLPDGPNRQLLEQMLLDEARNAAAIQHPNVAQYLDLGEQDGLLFLVMEWIDGEPVSSLIKRSRLYGGVPFEIGVEVAVQAARGLHAAHTLCDANGMPLGLVHCDVSPQNVMVTSSGAIKLIDFGIARATKRAAPPDDGLVRGKLSFMAPEQILGGPIDPRTDVFSLGLVLYLLTTGKHPFAAANPTETMRRIRDAASIPPPSVYHSEYPDALESVLLRALSHDPERRFANAEAFMTALSEAVPRRAEPREIATFVEHISGAELAARRAAIADALKRVEAFEPPSSEPPLSSRPIVGALEAYSIAPPSVRTADVESPPSSTVPATVMSTPAEPDFSPRRGKGFIASALAFGVAVAFGGFALRAAVTSEPSAPAASVAASVGLGESDAAPKTAADGAPTTPGPELEGEASDVPEIETPATAAASATKACTPCGPNGECCEERKPAKKPPVRRRTRAKRPDEANTVKRYGI